MGKKCFIFEILLGVTGVDESTYFTFKDKECNFFDAKILSSFV